MGLATAMTLTSLSSVSLVVLEAENRLAAHQTGHNSGVIHSGLYYKPGSLKAQNCVEGQKAMYRFCQEHGIAHEQCGKVVVATDTSELPALATLEERGKANSLRGVRRLKPEEIKAFAKQQLFGYMGMGMQQEEQPWIADYINRMMQDRKFVEDTYHRIQTEKVFDWAEQQVKTNEQVVSVEEFSKEAEKHQHHQH